VHGLLARWLLGAGLLGATATATPDARADAEPSTESSTAPPSTEPSEEAPKEPSEAPPRPLAELPDPPSIALPDPTKADLEALDALLARLTDAEPMVRERAVRELLEVQTRWVPSLHTRLDKLADRANKGAMRDALDRIRAAKRQELRANPGEGGSASDFLAIVVERAEPANEIWRNLVHALAMSRMLRHINTAAAARSLVHVYVRYGEFLRINTQLELEAMGDRSIAALIEARRHPAQKIAQWAERQLDLRGKAIAGEALRTEDPEALADILRAFGRIRDPDSARVIISFAQSERAQLRGAAREALVLLGEVATWQLRDAYENTMGKRAPREWSWQRTARELFSEFDRLRQAEQYDLFEQGQAAHRAGKLEEMVERYDRVLAFNPMFERRDEMTAGYLDYVRAHGDQHPERAVAALRTAERVASSDKERRALQSLRLTFEARRLIDRGIVDQGLLHQAMALDPSNRLAEETLEAALTDDSLPLSPTTRYWGAAAIAGISLLGAGGILWIGARRRRSVEIHRDSPSNDDEPPAEEGTDDEGTDDQGTDDQGTDEAQARDGDGATGDDPLHAGRAGDAAARRDASDDGASRPDASADALADGNEDIGSSAINALPATSPPESDDDSDGTDDAPRSASEPPDGIAADVVDSPQAADAPGPPSDGAPAAPPAEALPTALPQEGAVPSNDALNDAPAAHDDTAAAQTATRTAPADALADGSPTGDADTASSPDDDPWSR